MSQLAQTYRVYVLALLLCLIFSLPSHLVAQDNRGFADLDTIPGLELQLESLFYEPFKDDPAALMDYFNLIRAYEIWTSSRRLRPMMSMVERLDILNERARAEMVAGIFLSLILEEYVDMESGVLPITDTAIARLDSAQMRYNEMLRFGVQGTEQLYRMESDFSRMVSDSLKGIRNAFESESIYAGTQAYDARRMIVNCYDAARKNYPAHVYRRTLAHWFYESVNKKADATR